MDPLESPRDSATEVADAVYLVGLWIHDPDSPQSTSTNFLYGKNSRGYDVSLSGGTLVLAGREFGVTNFGEHREDTFSVTVKIPHGPDYNEQRELLRSLVLSRKTMVFRDNRSVVVFGTCGSLSEGYESDGSDFSFEVNRVHKEIFEVS